MMPEGASEDRADQLAALGVIAHEMMVAPDMAELLARAEEARRARSVARRQPARDAARVDPRERAAVRSGRGAHPRVVGLRDGVARGQEERRLQGAAADAHRSRDHHQAGRRGQGGGARAVALRRAARRVRAGRPLARASTRCSPSSRPSCRRCCSRSMERQKAAGAVPLDGPFPVEAQRQLGVEMARTLGFDFHHGRLDGRRIRSPAARRTTCASPRATTRGTSPAP